MKISTRARYALRFMIDLADHREGSPVILREVAGRQQISKRYLEQMATSLRNADLVSAAQGRGGGYTLLKPPETISILEIITASIGPINVVRCVNHPEVCTRSGECPSRKMWERLNVSINEVFGSVTLADLCEDHIDGAVSLAGVAAPCSRAGVRE